jgi:hypothetical protein
VDLIYTNFSNPFYRVRHCLLLDKMSSDIGPAHCPAVTFLLYWWSPGQKNGKLCFEMYFGYFGRSIGQQFGTTLFYPVCE